MYKVSKREVLFDTSGKSTCLATYKLAVVTVIIRHARKLVLKLGQCQKTFKSGIKYTPFSFLSLQASHLNKHLFLLLLWEEHWKAEFLNCKVGRERIWVEPNNMVYGIHSLLKPQEVTGSEQRENFCTFDTLRAFLSRCFSLTVKILQDSTK